MIFIDPLITLSPINLTKSYIIFKHAAPGDFANTRAYLQADPRFELRPPRARCLRFFLRSPFRLLGKMLGLIEIQNAIQISMF